MRLYCTRCKLPIPGESINIRRHVARCKQCNAIYPFDPEEPAKRMPNATVALPKGMTLASSLVETAGSYREHKTVNELVLVYRHYAKATAVPRIVVGTVAGAPALIYAIAVVLSGGVHALSLVPVVLLWVLIACLLVASGITRLVDRTTLTIRNDSLCVRVTAFPYFGSSVTAQTDRVEQLYTEGDAEVGYVVKAIVRDAPTLEIVRGLETQQQSAYVESIVEQHLNIVDCPELSLKSENE